MQLRDYQIESIQGLRDGFRVGGRQVLCAPTGAGKSVIALEMIRLAMAKKSKVWFMVERRVLANQFSAHLAAAEIPHGVKMAKHWRWRPDEPIQVVSAQTVAKIEVTDPPDILFIDEVHCCIHKSVIDLFLKFPKMKVVGLTATPFNPKLSKYFENLVSVTTMQKLVADKNLVPFRVFAAAEIDTKGVKINSKGEYNEEEIGGRAKLIIGDVVADYLRISQQVFGELRKGIVFSSGISHGEELARKFNEAGVLTVQLTANDTDEHKQATIADFERQDTPIKLLISSEMLQRGFDVKDIYFVILACVIRKSFSKFVQEVGRGARPYQSKEFCVINDHGGNWLRHNEQWKNFFHNGVTSLLSDVDSKDKKEPTKKEKEAAKCPSCGQIWVGDTCSTCGHIRQRNNEIVTVAGEMSELNETPKKPKKCEYTTEQKQRFYQELLGYMAENGKKSGEAYFKYKEKFGVYPSTQLDRTPIPPSAEVSDFVRSRYIAYAKSKQRRETHA